MRLPRGLSSQDYPVLVRPRGIEDFEMVGTECNVWVT